ncbi:MAG: CPBP family intramembrane metalloprotease [Acidimicrobiales bacterium]|nr:CPBP family intramembrane metalloprotease [Acidimicrobiales bacterium]
MNDETASSNRRLPDRDRADDGTTDTAVAVDEALPDHGISPDFGISWPAPLPLIVALASFFGAPFVAAVVGQVLLMAVGIDPYPSAAQVLGQSIGQLSQGQGASVTGPDVPVWISAIQFLVGAGLLAGPPVVVALRRGMGPVRDLGLRVVARDVPVGLGIGAACQLLVPVLYFVLRPFLGDRDVSEAARQTLERGRGGVGVAVVVALVVLVAPVTEEIFFRGLVLRAAERAYGPTAALIGTSLLFALYHFQLLQFPALLVLAVILGTIAMRTGRLGTAIFAHLGFNLTAVILVLGFPGLLS